MSQEALQRFTDGTSFEGDAPRIQDLGEQVLDRLLHPPDPAVATGLAACALRFVQAGWGIYGFGLRRIKDSWIGDEPVDDATVVTLTVDYAWLMTDLRDRDARSPFISVAQAEFARGELLSTLGLDLPDWTVLQGSSLPVPFSAGDPVYWETRKRPSESGVVGPPIKLQDGSGRTGYLTAGHVTPEDQSSDPAKAFAEIGRGANPIQASVLQTMTPAPIAGGGKPTGSVDAAILLTDPPPSAGIGAAGSGRPDDPVTKRGGAQASPGIVVGYDQWTVTSRGGLWKDNYSVQSDKQKASDPRFAVRSDSGAAVHDSTNGAVIGIVVGGAKLVPGCSDSIVYVQDIDTICTDLGVDVLP